MITFTINIVVLLVVTDAIMVVLFRSISTEVISRTNAEAATFNTATNNYVAISTANMIIGVFNLYANLLLQVLSCYNYFSTQSNLYTSH